MRLDPRRWPRLEVSDFSSRVYRSRRIDAMGTVSLRHSLPSEEKHWACDQGLSASCRVPCRVRYFASSTEERDPGDSLRGEATGAEGVKRLLSHSSEFNREYVITVRWHRTAQLGALFLSSPIFLSSEVARSRLPFIQPVERYTLAYWNQSRSEI